MSLWNVIRDFFVQYIFGGTLSDNTLVTGNLFGRFMVQNGSSYYFMYNDTTASWISVGSHYINMGDWLSTTLTMITMLGFCIFLYLVIRWFFRIGSSLISYR